MTDKILDEVITVELLGSGYAATHRVLVDEGDGDPYWDIQQTGFGRYKTRKEAEVEAKMWSKSDEIKLDDTIK